MENIHKLKKLISTLFFVLFLAYGNTQNVRVLVSVYSDTEHTGKDLEIALEDLLREELDRRYREFVVLDLKTENYAKELVEEYIHLPNEDRTNFDLGSKSFSYYPETLMNSLLVGKIRYKKGRPRPVTLDLFWFSIDQVGDGRAIESTYANKWIENDADNDAIQRALVNVSLDELLRSSTSIIPMIQESTEEDRREPSEIVSNNGQHVDSPDSPEENTINTTTRVPDEKQADYFDIDSRIEELINKIDGRSLTRPGECYRNSLVEGDPVYKFPTEELKKYYRNETALVFNIDEIMNLLRDNGFVETVYKCIKRGINDNCVGQIANQNEIRSEIEKNYKRFDKFLYFYDEQDKPYYEDKMAIYPGTDYKFKSRTLWDHYNQMIKNRKNKLCDALLESIEKYFRLKPPFNQTFTFKLKWIEDNIKSGNIPTHRTSLGLNQYGR